jgi:hypothetical protein
VLIVSKVEMKGTTADVKGKGGATYNIAISSPRNNIPFYGDVAVWIQRIISLCIEQTEVACQIYVETEQKKKVNYTLCCSILILFPTYMQDLSA